MEEGATIGSIQVLSKGKIFLPLFFISVKIKTNIQQTKEPIMKNAEFDINAAEGVYLNTSYQLDGKFYPAGHVLNKEDIIIFKMFDITRVSGSIMEENDIPQITALGMVAAKICGHNTAFKVEDNGSCHIIATIDGLFISSEPRISKFNRLHPCIVLNTIAPYQSIKKGDVIATLELTTPLIPQSEIDEVLFNLSGNVSLLQVQELKSLRTAFIYAKIQDNNAENEHFQAVVTKLVSSMSSYQLNFMQEYSAFYTQNYIADSLQNAVDAGFEAIFIVGAARTANPQDVIPTAISSVADDIIEGICPIYGASDLFMASKRQARIIALPYNYAQTNTDIIDRCIKQVLYSDKFSAADFSWIMPPFYQQASSVDTKELSSFVTAKNTSSKSKKASIAAIVLAAGVGSRAGRNKLISEMSDGEPLFMHAVKAAIASDASPVFVITGHNADIMNEFLDKVDVNIIHNSSYRAGVKTSIDIGLKSVPNFCDGAMLIPADMPNITATELNKLISSFRKDKDKQICVLSHKGIKSNHIIWSQSLYSKADVVPENAHLRPVFMEHADYTNVTEIKDPLKLLDVNYPSDIENLQKSK